MKTYAELLRDPRWQKKRLEILQRDGFHCVQCVRIPDELTSEHPCLHVHHTFYEGHRAPWEYPDYSLKTLCEGCHQAEHDNREASEKFMLQTIRRYGVLDGELMGLGLFFEAYAIETGPEKAMKRLTAWLNENTSPKGRV